MEKLIHWRKSLTPPTLEHAASLIGVSAVQMHRMEKGKRQVSLLKLPVVSAVTGIPARELRPDVFEAVEQSQ